MAVAIHQRLRDQQAIATSDLELIVLGYCSKLLFHRCKLVSWCIQRDPKGSEIMERYVPLTVVLLVITMGCALARDYGYHNSPEISEWFKNLERPDLPGPRGNRSCCDVSDCHRTEFTLKDGHYRARVGRIINGTKPPVWELTEWVDVPDNAVIRDKGNPVGEAIICHGESTYDTDKAYSIPHIYCFVPGNLS